jgi:hypothetical protein
MPPEVLPRAEDQLAKGEKETVHFLGERLLEVG